MLLTCLLWDEPAIHFGVRKCGGGSKNRKTNHAQEKKEKKIGTQGSTGKPFYLYASLTYFWDLYNGDVRKKIYFRILFE